MANKVSVTHMIVASTKIIFTLFQMAILPSFLKRLGSGG
jgi:hypothetical protein